MTVRLVGSDEEGEVVLFEDFRTFCDKMAECLRRSELAVTRHTGSIRYRVVDLDATSATMILEAKQTKKRRDQRAEVLAFFKADHCHSGRKHNL